MSFDPVEKSSLEPRTARKRRPRRPRFALRTLMLLFVIVSAVFAWLGILINSAHQERLAVERMSEMGGNVVYEYQQVRSGVVPDPPGPKWLHPALGDHFFAQVKIVTLQTIVLSDEHIEQLEKLRSVANLSLPSCTITDEQCARISRLPGIENLSLWGTTVSDFGIAHLAGHPNISMLALTHTSITDEAIEAIKTLPRLEHLFVEDTYITRDGIDELLRVRPSLHVVWEPAPSQQHREAAFLLGIAGAPVFFVPPDEGFDARWFVSFVHPKGWSGDSSAYGHLKDLSGHLVVTVWSESVGEVTPQLAMLPNLMHTNFLTFLSDDDLAALGSQPSLSGLHITDTQITDEGLQFIAGKSNLKELRLRRNPAVTDAGMVEIAKLKGLETLNLDQANIGDAALAPLGTMDNLKALHLGSTRVTDAGITKLVGLSELKELGLYNNLIADRSIATLGQMTSLEWLNLNGTLITDDAIPSLLKLTNLKELFVGKTKVTREGLKRLRDGLPNCNVYE